MTPIINFNEQVWYTGWTSKEMSTHFPNVQLSYNLDSLMQKVHPHEGDLVMAPVTKIEVPKMNPRNAYAFMQPVLNEALFFNRESFVRVPVALRRARLMQQFDYQTMFTSKGGK